MKNVAILVDVENTRPGAAKPVIEEASKYGRVIFKRAYADFNKENLKVWKQICSDLGLETIQQFSHVAKRGSSDGALIVDGMCLMFTTNVDIFCIVSSDCDFTKMAIAMRGHEKTVVGLGGSHTPICFQNACEHFVYIENLIKEPLKKESDKQIQNIKVLEENIIEILQESTKENINLSYIKDVLMRKYTSFDTRNYGFKTMLLFIKQFETIEVYSIPNVGVFVRESVKYK